MIPLPFESGAMESDVPVNVHTGFRDDSKTLLRNLVLASGLIFRIGTSFALFCLASAAHSQERAHPLKPPDRSSPRATLQTFLNSADAAATFVAQRYRESPSRQGFDHLQSLVETPVQCLDLREIPPAVREEAGSSAALALYETLNRIELPLFDQIPSVDQFEHLTSTNTVRWVIPNTEITLVRMESGPHIGEFLFSADTVARAGEFYRRVRGLPYARPVPAKDLYEMRLLGAGWLIPFSWIEAMPSWLRAPWGRQATWKWIALALVLVLYMALLRLAYRLSRSADEKRPLLQALARLALPAFLVVSVPILGYIVLVQISIIGVAGGVIKLVATTVLFLAGAWLAWRAAPVVAEAIVASPKIGRESFEAHLIRICARLLGLVAAAGLLAAGADRLGLPVYGIVAGLGVGGLAIALAAQPTIENLIGSLSLFADKPIRVGDLCKYGDELGTVEAIGIRSTRIRGRDRTLTTIPNAGLSKMAIVNYTQRDQMLIKAVIGVRYETTPEQLRYVLAKLREMLLGHPRINPEPARVRFIGFGSSSLDIEVFAYATTQDIGEFFAIREDVFVRIMDIVEQSGTGFAFPSQTLYMSRDGGLDAARTKAAEAQVRQWREENNLPFPNFMPVQNIDEESRRTKEKAP